MGFEARIRHKVLLEWRENYISYRLLKFFFLPFKTTARLFSLLDAKKPQRQKPTVLELLEEERVQLQGFFNNFTANLASELLKIHEFLDRQVRTCEAEWTVLKARIGILNRQSDCERKTQDLAEIEHVYQQFYLKLAFIAQFFRTNEEILHHVQVKFLVSVLAFQEHLQIRGNRSINAISLSRMPKLNRKPLLELQTLLEKSRSLYLFLYYPRFARATGERTLKELVRQTQNKIVPQKTKHLLFLFAGIGFTLFLMIVALIFDQGFDPDSSNQAKLMFKYQFPIFRGFLMVVLYLFLLAFNVWGWMRNHLNYRAVFGFERHYSSTTQILARSTFFTSLWLLTFFLFLVYLSYFGSNSKVLGVLPIYYLAGLNWLLFLGYLFFPHPRLFNAKGRTYFFREVYKVMTRSFIAVEFPMIFILNQFTSFVSALKDLEYTICFYVSIWLEPEKHYPSVCMNDTFQIGFIVSFVPLLLRIVQCVRTAVDRREARQRRLDWVNVGKFVTSGIVSLLSFLVGKLKSDKSSHSDQIFALWIAMASVSTVYSYSWDIKMGWMLCQKGYGLLRKDLHYDKWFYYTAILLNLIFRLTWVLNISPDVVNTIFWRPELSTFVLGLMEMVRRMIWNFLRVDKEAVINKKGFGFIQDITINLNEVSVRSSLEKNRKTIGNVSLESQSSFSVDDLMKRDPANSTEDFKVLRLNEKMMMISDDSGDIWELVEEKKAVPESVEELKKAMMKFERSMREKSRNNTFIDSNKKG